MLERALKDIGLTDKEVSVYLTSLKLGSQPVSVIAKRAHLNRTTTYVILKKLLEKGLMSKYSKGGMIYFTSSSPESIKNYIERKKKELDLVAENIENLLPDLEKIMQYSPSSTKIRFFEGLEGIKALYDYTLEVGERVDEYLFHYDADVPEMWNFWDIYISRRIEKGIPLRLLAAEDEISLWSKQNDKELLRETRILPHDKFPFGHNLILIFGDYYGYISYADGVYGGALIHDKYLAEVERSIYQYIWDSTENFDKKMIKKHKLDDGKDSK
ncbi:MAG: helix-turn-helix domain-containing protein [bacterium]|nr:helix-turn-helix domain-containing protein [bacterium]MDZ4245345.1 helix-turn-helix domain-containing protein [Candidatus Gracilibacteria bacterium]